MAESKKVLVTGAAGFIGFHLSRLLCSNKYKVVGIDNLNPYYDVNLKKSRLKQLEPLEGFSFYEMDLREKEKLSEVFEKEEFNYVIHLAAQAGVRYSIENPYAYLDANIYSFLNILENCRHHSIGHLVFASSSSVYGANKRMPFSVHDNVDHPVSLYAASKKSNELMAHTYSVTFNVPCTGLRFFTVYGPWGRPDMALFKFTKAILADEEIDVYNFGDMSRDFTYIDDIVNGVSKILNEVPEKNDEWSGLDPDPGSSFAPYRIFNIGSNHPYKLMEFIEILEDTLGKKAKINLMPMQKGDVESTYADVGELMNRTGFKPGTDLRVGVKNFVEWYKEYYS